MSIDVSVTGEEIAPGIFIFEDAFTNYEEILKKSEELPENRKSFAHLNNGSVNKSIRNNIAIDLTPSYDVDEIWWKTCQKLWQYGNAYALFYDTGFSGIEPPQLLRYYQQDGFYKSHSDSSAKFPRVFSAVLYLNDVEEGGETYFDRFDISVNPKAGRLAIFPANYMYSHQAKVPVSGEKNVVVTWFVPG